MSPAAKPETQQLLDSVRRCQASSKQNTYMTFSTYWDIKSLITTEPRSKFYWYYAIVFVVVVELLALLLHEIHTIHSGTLVYFQETYVILP